MKKICLIVKISVLFVFIFESNVDENYAQRAIRQSYESVNTVDPENEGYYKVYFGYQNNKIVIGIQSHVAVSTSLYIDLNGSLFLEDLLNDNYENAFYFDSTLTIAGINYGSRAKTGYNWVGLYGYRRVWLKPNFIKFSNLIFTEAIE